MQKRRGRSLPTPRALLCCVGAVMLRAFFILHIHQILARPSMWNQYSNWGRTVAREP
jgi:hypothetical protein